MNQETNPKNVSPLLFFLFLSLVFIRPFISEMAYPITAGYIRIAILMLFLACLLSSKEFRIAKNPFNKPLLLYCIAIAASLLYTINLRSSLHQIYQLMPLLCLFYFASNLEKKQSVKLIKFLICIASVLSIYGIYQYLWGLENTKDYLSLHLKDALQTRYAREILITKRAIATFFSPNMFAAYLAMTIPLCGGLLLDNIKNKKRRLVFGFFAICMLAALLLTKSMAGAISLCFGVIVFLVFARRRPSRKIFIFFIFILLLLLFLLLLRYDMFINISNQQNTILQRLSFWRSTSGIIRDFVFKGVGIGNLGSIYPKYRELVANETRLAHNIFLQTWAEIGLLGLISMILLVWAFIKSSIKIERNFFNIGIIASCYVFLVNNLFDFSYFIPQVSYLWWISLGLVAQNLKRHDVRANYRLKLFIALMVLIVIYLNTKSTIASTYFQKEAYRKAIALEPYNDLYYARINEYDKAIALNPYFPFYRKNLAFLHLDKNMIKEAIVEFEKASELCPADESLHQQLFDLYTETGQIEKAKKERLKLEEFHSKYSGYFIR